MERQRILEQSLALPRMLIDMINTLAGPRIQNISILPEGLIQDYQTTLPDLPDEEWKTRCQQDFSAFLYDLNSKSSFGSWKCYHAYLYYMFKAQPRTVHLYLDDPLPDNLRVGDIVTRQREKHGYARTYVYTGTETVHISAIPKYLRIFLKIPPIYYRNLGITLPFNAYDLELYLDWVDVDELNGIYFVVFIHFNVAYCITFEQARHVVLFNFTVYIQERFMGPPYEAVAAYVGTMYRVHPDCVFSMNFGATTGNKLNDE